MLADLTSRQKSIYEFLSVTIREHGYAPSIPEIGQKFKITLTRGVFDHLKALERKGYKKGLANVPLRLSASPEDPLSRMPKKFPSLAGSGPVPLLAEENLEGFFPVANELAGGKETFALKVSGDSMIEDGILDGDLVIIRQQHTAENGDISAPSLETKRL